MSHGKEFSRFVTEFGSKDEEEKEQEKEEDSIEEDPKTGPDVKTKKKAVGGVALMQVEERNTGAISGQVYKTYLKAGRGKVVVPLLISALVFMQCAMVIGSYW